MKPDAWSKFGVLIQVRDVYESSHAISFTDNPIIEQSSIDLDKIQFPFSFVLKEVFGMF